MNQPPGPVANVRVETRASVIGFASENRYRYVTVRQKRLYSMWVGCDTCSVLFDRDPSTGLTRADVADRLRHGPEVADEDLLRAIASLLPRGDYAVADVRVRPVVTAPGGPDDYFSRESVEVFGHDAGHTNTIYWRAADVDRFATAAAFAAHAGVSPAALLDSGARTASRSSASRLDPRRAARRVGDG